MPRRRLLQIALSCLATSVSVNGWSHAGVAVRAPRRRSFAPRSTVDGNNDAGSTTTTTAAAVGDADAERHVVVIGAGWGGLSAAHALSKTKGVRVTVVDAASRPGGLVGDGYVTPGGRRAEAGIHGFWGLYGNIFGLIDELKLEEDPLTGYAEQGQVS